MDRGGVGEGGGGVVGGHRGRVAVRERGGGGIGGNRRGIRVALWEVRGRIMRHVRRVAVRERWGVGVGGDGGRCARMALREMGVMVMRVWWGTGEVGWSTGWHGRRRIRSSGDLTRHLAIARR